MMKKVLLGAAVGAMFPLLALSDTEFVARMSTVTEWKSVFGQVAARDMVPARARIGGTLIEIGVEEGSKVSTGQVVAVITDAKLDLQLESVNARIDGLNSQLDNALSELTRGEELLKNGVTTVQRLDGLRTQVSVLENQIEATRAEKRVIEQRASEGAVLAPIAGMAIDVPVTSGSVMMPGEIVAMIGGGGVYLRLAVPERHASFLKQGLTIRVGDDENIHSGRLIKIYPQIENGRVIADVEIDGLNSDFISARIPVRIPVGVTDVIMVPADMVISRMGLDFVSVKQGDTTVQQVVVTGGNRRIDGVGMVEILTGLSVDSVVVQIDE
jgi:RND family efflux transporter MFP subunit